MSTGSEAEPEAEPEASPKPRRTRAPKATAKAQAEIAAEPSGDDDLLPTDVPPKPKRRTRKVADDAATPPSEEPRA